MTKYLTDFSILQSIIARTIQFVSNLRLFGTASSNNNCIVHKICHFSEEKTLPFISLDEDNQGKLDYGTP